MRKLKEKDCNNCSVKCEENFVESKPLRYMDMGYSERMAFLSRKYLTTDSYRTIINPAERILYTLLEVELTLLSNATKTPIDNIALHLLLTGNLTYEKIFNKEQTKIIGYKQLSADSLSAAVDTGAESPNYYWIQSIGTPFQRNLYKTQIGFINVPNYAEIMELGGTPDLVDIIELTKLQLKTEFPEIS